MEFKIGTKVQAIDELGRWENGKIVSSDDGHFEVKFDGWDAEYNVWAKTYELRKPVDIFWSDIDAVSNTKRKTVDSGRKQFSVLHTLAAGDTVLCSIEKALLEATVKVVDRFRREVTVQVEGESEDRVIKASKLVQATEEEDLTTLERRQRKVGRKTSSKNNVSTTSQIADPDNNKTDVEDGTTFFSIAGGDGSLLSCGEVVDVRSTHTSLKMVISSLKKKASSFEAEGCLHDGRVVEDITIKVPIEKIYKVSKPVPMTAKEKKTLKDWQDRAFTESLNLRRSNFQYRQEVRRQELRFAILKEVHAALKSKVPKRRFTLGISNLEIDLSLLNLDFFCRRHVKYNYHENSLGQLDYLLGDKWDVFLKDNVLSFVTQVTIWLTSQVMLQGSISHAHCYDNFSMDKNYRTKLARYMSSGANNDEVLLG